MKPYFFVWHDRFKTNVLAQAAEAEGTGANRRNGERNLCSLCFLLSKSGPGGVVELDFDKSVSDGVNISVKRGDEPDFTVPAPCSGLSTINSQPSTTEKLREYKCVYVLNDEEIGLFSEEVVVKVVVN